MATTVTVACKLPSGLHLDHQGVRVTLNGANTSRIIGGFGLTDVDKDFWDAWLAEHKEFPPVKEGLIFSQSTSKSAESEAKEKTNLESGFEGINPDRPGGSVEPA